MTTNEHVVNIIKRDKSGSPVLDAEKLKQLLVHTDASDVPVAFYSICGSARTGKSFLWNQFVCFLKEKEQGSSKLKPAKYIEKFFEWKGGDARYTDGILVYRHPFMKRTSKHKKIALFLMDTQGMFDDTESGQNSGVIITLSFLISSLQVYNVQTKLESIQLQHSYKCMKILKTTRKCKPGTKPLQSLMFLIRDWRRTRSYNHGLSGGGEYVGNYMETKALQASDQRNVRKEIQENFENCSGFLLPEPGDNVVDMHPEDNRCSNEDIDEKFSEFSEQLFQHLWKEENIIIKAVDGIALKGETLYEYLKAHGEKIPDFPDVNSSFSTFIEHDNRNDMCNITMNALSSYITNLCEEFQNDRTNIRKSVYEAILTYTKELSENFQAFSAKSHQSQKNVVMKKFKAQLEFESIPLNDKWEESLKEMIDEIYSKFEHDKTKVGEVACDAFSNYIDKMLKNIQSHRGENLHNRFLFHQGHKYNKNIALEEFRKDSKEVTSEEMIKNRWEEYLKGLLVKTYDTLQGFKQRHEVAKHAAIEEFKISEKPGREELHERWKNVLKELIEKNYNKFMICERSEEVFLAALEDYAKTLRSSIDGIFDLWNRIKHPKDEAKKRSEEARKSAIKTIKRELENKDELITKQCCSRLNESAKILLDQHLDRINNRILGVAFAIPAGASALALSVYFELAFALAVFKATKTTAALVGKAALVGGAASLIPNLAIYGIQNYFSSVEQMINRSWAEGGDDLSCIEVEIVVALSYGIVRFRMENETDSEKIKKSH